MFPELSALSFSSPTQGTHPFPTSYYPKSHHLLKSQPPSIQSTFRPITADAKIPYNFSSLTLAIIAMSSISAANAEQPPDSSNPNKLKIWDYLWIGLVGAVVGAILLICAYYAIKSCIKKRPSQNGQADIEMQNRQSRTEDMPEPSVFVIGDDDADERDINVQTPTTRMAAAKLAGGREKYVYR